MSFFKQLRRSTDGNAIVKELAEELRRYQASEGIEDISLLRQMRVDTDNIAYGDTNANVLDGDLTDTDTLAASQISVDKVIAKGAYVMENSTQGNLQMWLRTERGTSTNISGTSLTVTDGSTLAYAGAAYFPADSSSTSHITVTDNALIRVQANYSIGFRMFATDISQDSGANRRILQKYDDANNEYNIAVYDTGLIGFTVKRAGATSSGLSVAGTIAANAPYHVLVTYNAGTIVVYINGTASAGGTGSLSTDTGTADLTIGKRGTSAISKYKGYLWDIRYYNTTLDATAAANLANGYSRYGLAGIANVCDVAP